MSHEALDRVKEYLRRTAALFPEREQEIKQLLDDLEAEEEGKAMDAWGDAFDRGL